MPARYTGGMSRRGILLPAECLGAVSIFASENLGAVSNVAAEKLGAGSSRRNFPSRRNLLAEAEPTGGTSLVAEDAAKGPSYRQYVSAQDPSSRRDVLARDLEYQRNAPAAVQVTATYQCKFPENMPVRYRLPATSYVALLQCDILAQLPGNTSARRNLPARVAGCRRKRRHHMSHYYSATY
jgi:hypothetical protein